MTAPVANLINAIVLIVLSLWAYAASSMTSFTPLIPATFGVVLLLCTPGVRAENKVIAHIAVLATLVILIMLIMPLRSAVQTGNSMGLYRALLMMTTSAFAIYAFVQSFRAARRNRDSAG